MSHSDDEIMSQYIDGELSEHESAALLRRLEQEPELAKRLEKLSRVDSVLRDTFTGMANEPPEHLVDMLQAEQSNVVPLQRSPRPLWLGAVAASLLAVVGFLVGQQWPGNSTTPLLPQAAAINLALDSKPSSATDWHQLESGFNLRPVLSFSDKSGTYCREYELLGNGQGWRGVACRTQGEWQTRVLVNQGTAINSTDHYRTAAAGDSEIITSFIDQHIDGIPLGAAEENSRINDQWR